MRSGFDTALSFAVICSFPLLAQTPLRGSSDMLGGSLSASSSVVRATQSFKKCVPVAGADDAFIPVCQTENINNSGEQFVPSRWLGERVQVSASAASFESIEDPSKALSEGNRPRLGQASAPVTIVLFGDFECAFCRRISQILQSQVIPQNKSVVSLVYRYFPLPQHPWSRPAAEMAACVARQDSNTFWQLSEFLYANQNRISALTLRPEVLDFAKTHGVTNALALTRCIDDHESSQEVEEDLRLGAALGIHSTPTIFVNDELLFGVHDAKQLNDAIREALLAVQPDVPIKEHD